MTTPAAAIAVDVLIIGAGPAGLACATALSRQLHTSLVLSSAPAPSSSTTSSSPDTGDGAGFRNARAQHMHNVLGWDHAPPSAFRARARADVLARYAATVQFRDGVEVVRVEAKKNYDDNDNSNGKGVMGFRAVDSRGQVYEGRRLVIASGVRDVMPDIPGYAELWGRGIFHCLFCHGYEERGAPTAGVLATGALAGAAFAATIARMASRLAGAVNVYTDGDGALGTQIRAALRSTKRFRVDDRRIARLDKDPAVGGEAGVLVALVDGSVVREGFLAHAPDFELNGPFAKDLGLAMAPQGHIDAQPPFYSTNVPGVYAAGDCAAMIKAVPAAAMMGSCVAAGLAHVLQAEDDVEE